MSTARYLLDTNICIYIHKHHPPQLLARFEKLKPGEAVISPITWGELMHGAEKSHSRKKVLAILEEFAAVVSVLPLAERVGQVYGEIRAILESQGKPIGNNDLWIAAHAKAEGLTLITNNEREFKRVPGLKVLNWAE